MYLKIRKPVKWHAVRISLNYILAIFIIILGTGVLLGGRLEPMYLVLLGAMVLAWILLMLIQKKFSSGPISAIDFQPMFATVIADKQQPRVLDYEQFAGELILHLDSWRHKGGTTVFVSRMGMIFHSKETGEVLKVEHEPNCALGLGELVCIGTSQLWRILPFWESFAEKSYRIEVKHDNDPEWKKKEKLLNGIRERIAHRSEQRPLVIRDMIFFVLIVVLTMMEIKIFTFSSQEEWIIIGLTVPVALFFLVRFFYWNRQERRITADFIRQSTILQQRREK